MNLTDGDTFGALLFSVTDFAGAGVWAVAAAQKSKNTIAVIVRTFGMRISSITLFLLENLSVQ
jgi:hypothetical protein